MGETLASIDQWLAELQEQLTTYFSACTQNEWIAWGVNGTGFLLLIVGIVLFFV